MADVQEAIKMLRCAEVNCDNVKKGGAIFAQLVKAQIQDAIKALDGDIASDDVLAPYRDEEDK